jgi:hypothetical protein
VTLVFGYASHPLQRQLPLRTANGRSQMDVFSHFMQILFQLQLLRCKREGIDK